MKLAETIGVVIVGTVIGWALTGGLAGALAGALILAVAGEWVEEHPRKVAK